MLKKPLIGLTMYGRKETDGYSLPALYVDSVRQAGGIPILLPGGETHVKELCEQLDGVILSGGGDIHPDRYNGKHHPLIYNIDPERDASELKLTQIILEKNIPTLAICRGMQILNTFFGGTLHEHLPEKYGETILHRLPPRQTIKHMVKLSQGSRLHAIIGEDEIEIVSWHHQAVNDVPKNFSITATASDGVIEGMELDSHPWLVAVQWHPELSGADDILQQKLFKALIDTCTKK